VWRAERSPRAYLLERLTRRWRGVGSQGAGSRSVGFGLVLVAALLCAVGCGPPQAFMPAANVTQITPRGEKDEVYAAAYRMEADGRRLGEAKLWSRGVDRGDVEGKTRTLVHVGFILKNDTSAPLRLDEQRLKLEDVQLGEETIYDVPALTVDGELTVPPGATRDIDVAFGLPYRIWPGDVLAYRVRWRVDGERPYTEQTAFLRNGYRPGRYPGHAYYYDPYWYPYGYASFGLYPWYWPYYGPPYYGPYYGPAIGIQGRVRVAPFPRNYARPRRR
jgi:hypothetical protein